MRKKRARGWCILLCLCMMIAMFGGCGKRAQEDILPTKAPKPTEIVNPTATPIPRITDVPVSQGGFEFTGDYSVDYVDESIPKALRTAKIGQNGTNLSTPVDSAFLLTTEEEVSAQEITEHIHFIPEVKYAVNRVTETSYEIVPEEKLQDSSVYRVVLGDEEKPFKSFVFQTEKEVSVSSMFPADKSVSVPRNTGIEMTFSEVIAEDCRLKDYFTVSPAVDGQYQRYPDGKTVVFIPADELLPNTLYTVTVKAGLPGISGRTLSADRTAEFRTDFDTLQGNRKVVCLLSEQQLTLTTKDTPAVIFELYYDDEYEVKMNDTKVDIYSYSDAKSVISAMKNFEMTKSDFLFTEEGYRYPTEGLKKVDSLRLKTEAPEMYDMGGVVLPQLPAGNYLINATVSGSADGVDFSQEGQILLQVTDLCLYTESADGTLLFWVNDAEGAAISGASIAADCFERETYFNKKSIQSFTEKKTVTGKDGIAVLDLQENNAAFVLIEKDGQTCYACVDAMTTNEEQEYLSYVYSDRNVYFANDTAHFFGMVSPKKAGLALPEYLSLDVFGSVNKTKLKVNEDGTFTGEIKIEDYASYGISYRLYLPDGTLLASNYLRVTQEGKPLYKAALSFDKIFYHRYEKAIVTLTSTFYDGTPVGGLTFELQFSEFQRSPQTVTTGEDGTATITLPLGIASMNSTDVVYLSAYAYLTGEEDQNLTVSGSTLYFQSDRVVSVNRLAEKGKESCTQIKINERVLDQLLSEEDLNYGSFPENTIGAPLAETISYQLQKTEYIKENNGTTYDPISKTTRKLYRYRTEKTTEKEGVVTAVNGVITLPHVKVADDFNGYYQYIITYSDPSTGLIYTYTSYANEGSYFWYGSRDDRYEVRVTDGPFSLQDEVTCNLYYGETKVTNVPVLYTIHANNLFQYFVAQNGSYPFPFTEDMMLGAQICATVRSGSNVETLQNNYIEYDFTRNNQLSVQVETDRTVYRPGEEAVVTVKLLDKDGKPVSGTCLISVVDEACFALGEQKINVLQFFEQYQRSWFYVNRNGRFTCIGQPFYGYYGIGDSTNGMDMVKETAAVEMEDGKASSRGGEEVTVRENFSDNPMFTPITVLEDGTGRIVLKVPDNLTTWRLSAVALAGTGATYHTVSVGQTTGNIISTLPFFVNAEITDTFLRKDDVVACARIYGTELTSGTKVSYLAELKNAAGETLQTLSKEASAGEQIWFNFGKKEVGEYSVTVKAITENASDGMKLPFSVTESGVMVNIRKSVTVEELAKLNPLMYPVHLSFYDSSYDGYLRAVNGLFGGYSNRYDSSVAYFVAATCSEKLFGDENGFQKECDEIKKKISSVNGFIPEILYGEGNLALTAKIAAVAPEIFTEAKKAELCSLFQDYLSQETYESDEQYAATLLGLAALSQPVLSELYYAAANCGGFSLTAKLYLTAAFAYIGDFTAAGELYDSIAKEVQKQSAAGELCFEGATTEETIKNTANALLSAALIKKGDAEALYTYLSNHTSTLSLYSLEKCAFVKYFYPVDQKNAEFTYQIGETTEHVTLKIGEIFCLNLNKSDFEALKITDADENLRIRCGYLGSAAEAEQGNQSLNNVKLTKSVSLYDQERNLYKVTLNYTVTTDRNYACFTLSDYIPSGARYFNTLYDREFSTNNDWNYGAYLSNRGQYMQGSIYVYNYRENKLLGLNPITVSGSVSYLIRGAAEGEFAIDQAIITDRANGSYALSNGGMVTIKKDGWIIQ